MLGHGLFAFEVPFWNLNPQRSLNLPFCQHPFTAVVCSLAGDDTAVRALSPWENQAEFCLQILERSPSRRGDRFRLMA
jgi:hypothetical protein